MKSTLTRQTGMSLIELMVGLMFTTLLLSGIFGLLSTSLNSWRAGSSSSELQQTARFAADSIVRDLRYGDTYELENDMSIIYRTRKKNEDKAVVYRYHISTTDHILYKTNVTENASQQPVTGKNVRGANSIVINQNNEAIFTLLDENTVVITLTVTDTFTGQSWRINTAVVSLMQALK